VRYLYSQCIAVQRQSFSHDNRAPGVKQSDLPAGPGLLHVKWRWCADELYLSKIDGVFFGISRRSMLNPLKSIAAVTGA
jgi:hypothetical protein